MANLYDSERIIGNIEKIKSQIALAAQKSGRRAEDITLVAATKTVESELINLAIENGIDNIGENRVQELIKKIDFIDKGKIKTHFIGHLQKNKVKDIVGKVDMIQSVDSFELADKISNISQNKGICTDILIEVNIGKDENKFGIFAEDVEDLLYRLRQMRGIKVRGLMSILPICEKREQTRDYFLALRDLFVDIDSKSIDNISMDFLSMGMSSDYILAIECGSNMVRIGSALFGARI